MTKHSYHSASFCHATGGSDPRVRMGPIFATTQGLGGCCGYPVDGYQTGGASTGASGGSGMSPNGWLFSICIKEPERCRVLDGYDKGNGFSVWYVRLFFEDPRFASTAAARYRQLRASVWSDAAVIALFDRASTEMAAPGTRSVARWPDKAAWGGAPRDPTAVVGAPRDWTLARLRWLDGAWTQADDPATRGAPYEEEY